MPDNPSSSRSTSLLSIGDVVSAGIRIYRDHLKQYFGLSFIAHLWVLLPIYGWAKYSAISALISRLAFCETIERPETVSEARSQVNPRMWSFLLAGFLVYLIYVVPSLVGALSLAVLVGIMAVAFTQGGSFPIVPILLAVIIFHAWLLGLLWLSARLFIVEVPLTIENNVDASSAISRSWGLTKRFALRLIGVIIVAFLISLPLSIVVQLVSGVIDSAIQSLFPKDSEIFAILSFVATLVLSLASGSVLMPFWQSIKGVVYYDLRSRREGLGMQLRDSQ
jgi:membrane-anchored glycerophosphoryl diester phosphodiesterase (GDPDase)